MTLTSDRLTMSVMDTKTSVNLLMTAIADSVYDEGACGEMAMDEDGLWGGGGTASAMVMLVMVAVVDDREGERDGTVNENSKYR